MFTLNCKGTLLVVENPVVMGIINCTPDSFFEGSRFTTTAAIVQKAAEMLQDGAAILDIGAQSTRPNSIRIDANEEIKRVIPGIRAIKDRFPEAIISIDTFYANVAVEAVEAGASMINDVSGGVIDERILETVAKFQVPYICMHMKGTPDTMQEHPSYENITSEVLDFFIDRIGKCREAGINDIIIDPGFGFGKTIEHNFQLLKNLSVLNILDKPILVGISRKSTIYKTLGITSSEALNGTTVLNSFGLLNGANILRVHDVKEAMETVRLFNAYHVS